MEQHAAADKAGEASGAGERLAEPDEVHGQIKRRERQAGRIEALWAANTPQRGTRGQALQSHLTDNESANMPTGPGVIQGYNRQALVEAKDQVSRPAEALGNGQDDGHVAPMVEGAKATLKAIGVAAHYFEGERLSADSHDHSEANRKACAHEQLDADIPAPHFRQRAPRFAPQERHQQPTEEKGSVADFTYDEAQACYTCPQGKVLTLEARRPKRGNRISRRSEADEAGCGACPLRAQCLHTVQTRGKPLAGQGERVHKTGSQQMIAKIDTPAARKS